jgi:hypothetical protein
MLFRGTDGLLVEINRLKYPNDVLYYTKIQTIQSYVKQTKERSILTKCNDAKSLLKKWNIIDC